MFWFVIYLAASYIITLLTFRFWGTKELTDSGGFPLVAIFFILSPIVAPCVLLVEFLNRVGRGLVKLVEPGDDEE